MGVLGTGAVGGLLTLLLGLSGCRAVSGADAGVRGDGLPPRVVTDTWVNVLPAGDSGDMGAGPDRSGAVVDGRADRPAGDVAAASDGGGVACDLLAVGACPQRQGCYPLPLEGPGDGRTSCEFAGAGSESIPCQSQLGCDATTICLAPGEPDSICVFRCDLRSPACPIGMNCVPFPPYAGVGVCRF